MYIHNIHNWPLQSFSQIYDVASHTTHVVYVHFIREWQDLEFKVDSERQIFECRHRNIFSCLTWGFNSGLTYNKPTHYLLDYGNHLVIVRSKYVYQLFLQKKIQCFNKFFKIQTIKKLLVIVQFYDILYFQYNWKLKIYIFF